MNCSMTMDKAVFLSAGEMPANDCPTKAGPFVVPKALLDCTKALHACQVAAAMRQIRDPFDRENPILLVWSLAWIVIRFL